MCTACNKPGLVLQSCETCYREVHLTCAKPPLKMRSKKWYCHACKAKTDFKQLKTEATRNKLKRKRTNRKKDSDNPTDSDDSDEAIAIKVRRLEKKKEPDDDHNEKESKSENNGNNRGRRNSRRKLDEQPTPETKSSSRRNSRRIDDDDSTPKTNGTTRRSRRAGDELLLDNVSLYGLLTDIKNHQDSWPFDRPVNKAEVPDYYKVIQRPMDFAKIKSKLNLGEYSSNYDFMSDIQLVFTNCDLYNTNGSEIYQ